MMRPLALTTSLFSLPILFFMSIFPLKNSAACSAVAEIEIATQAPATMHTTPIVSTNETVAEQIKRKIDVNNWSGWSKHVEFWAFDLETTGLAMWGFPSDRSKPRDRIVELSLVQYRNGKPTGRSKTWFFNPGQTYNGSYKFPKNIAQHVHGLSAEFLQTRPTFSDSIMEILSFIKIEKIPLLVGHNILFDLRFLQAEIAHLPEGHEVKKYGAICIRSKDTLSGKKRRRKGVKTSPLPKSKNHPNHRLRIFSRQEIKERHLKTDDQYWKKKSALEEKSIRRLIKASQPEERARRAAARAAAREEEEEESSHRPKKRARKSKAPSNKLIDCLKKIGLDMNTIAPESTRSHAYTIWKTSRDLSKALEGTHPTYQKLVRYAIKSGVPEDRALSFLLHSAFTDSLLSGFLATVQSAAPTQTSIFYKPPTVALRAPEAFQIAPAPPITAAGVSPLSEGPSALPMGIRPSQVSQISLEIRSNDAPVPPIHPRSLLEEFLTASDDDVDSMKQPVN